MTLPMSSDGDSFDETQEAMVTAIMHRRDCDRDEAKVIMRRVWDRLGGYTHDEAKVRRPLPPGRDERAGT